MTPRPTNPQQPATEAAGSARRLVRTGWVYLLWAEGTQRFKIGFTARDVGRRAAEIDGMSAFPVRIQGRIEGTPSTEKRLHRYFRRFRSHGDWFALPEPAAWDALRIFGCL